MPEGPEVRKLANTINRQTRRAEIKEAGIVSGRYKRSPIEQFDRLPGATIDAVGNRGKLLIFNLVRGAETFYALSTLGMTGWWYRDFKAPRHTRLQLDLGGPLEPPLFFVDPRNFGTFKVVEEEQLNEKLDDLGPDVMNHPSPAEPFFERYERYGKHRPLAEVLLDQRVFCGVGNYIRADAMWHARINPTREHVDRHGLQRLWQACHQVCWASFNEQGSFWEVKEGRQKFTYGYTSPIYGQQASPTGHPIDTYVDKNGRTVWFCPHDQK